MENRRRMRRTVRFMLLALIALLALSAAYGAHIYSFNHTERRYNAGEICPDFAVSIAPRTGQTDSWPKILREDGRDVTYRGAIYDVTVDNTGDCDISDWELRVDITRDLFLNNAWCGTVEIHQREGDGEKTQTVDLRDYRREDLLIDYTFADPDLLIPLRAGDYIVYHPDYKTDEYPINHGDSEKLTRVVCGMIVYNGQDEEPLRFDDYAMEYRLQKTCWQSPVAFALAAGFLVWFVCLIACVTADINMRHAHARFLQDEHIISQSIGVFTHFFEAKDTYTTGHSQRVAQYSQMIARKLGFDQDALRKIYYIALMHDCGKCCIPDAILKKPGRLTPEEYEIIKSHTVKGAAMLEDFTSIEHIRDGVLYHHERYDGKGYPEGLSGEAIPLIARIICVADSFDAMNSRRCYRDMLTREHILSEIRDNRGRQFDPKPADALLELIREGKIPFSGETAAGT